MKKQVRFSLEKGDLLPTLLMLPALFMIVFVMIVPLIYGLSLSFFEVGFGETNFKENFVGASNYLRFFQDATAKKAVFNTLLFSLGATAGDLFFGTLGAALLLKVSERLGKVLRPIVTVPLLVSPHYRGPDLALYLRCEGDSLLVSGPVRVGNQRFPRGDRGLHGAFVHHHRPLVAGGSLCDHRNDRRAAVHTRGIL